MRWYAHPVTPVPLAPIASMCIPEFPGRSLLVIQVIGAPINICDDGGRIGPALPIGTFVFDITKGCEAAWFFSDPTGAATFAFAECLAHR